MPNDHPEVASDVVSNAGLQDRALPADISGHLASHAYRQPAEPGADTGADAGGNPPLLAAVPEKHAFVFTGSGGEYFRIWIVNLCLSLATLGIYSAWAKVRRLQYFDRNTQLGGAVFNFHGDPRAILKGRIVALGLLAAYHYAFGFSKVFGVAVVAFLLLALPWMMRSALRFRLRNTSYRALRFNFGGSLAGAYATYLPMLLLVLAPGALVALFPAQVWWASLSGLLYLAWPLMHAYIKRYQHRNLQFGSSSATYSVSGFKFLRPYFIAGVLGFLGMVILGMFIGAVVGVASTDAGIFGRIRSHGLGGKDFWLAAIMLFGLLISGYLAYLAMGPYLQVRIANLVWSNTRFPQVEIHSELRAWPFIRLQAGNLALTLLTLGLFRPFAVVRAYRYRLQHMAVTTSCGFEQLLAAEHQRAGSASGDSAAEFLGFDLSW
ncbi:MAG: YjgN family protein [Pseudomonadota bacterium]